MSDEELDTGMRRFIAMWSWSLGNAEPGLTGVAVYKYPDLCSREMHDFSCRQAYGITLAEMEVRLAKGEEFRLSLLKARAAEAGPKQEVLETKAEKQARLMVNPDQDDLWELES
jgi:hypothetical protein